MKIKVSEATPPQINWMVAQCEGALDRIELEQVNGFWMVAVPDLGCYYEPSTDWAQAGPIIEREEISVERRMPCMKDEQWGAQGWRAMQNFHVGPTPLVAAMRCYVASKMGDEIEIPEELK